MKCHEKLFEWIKRSEIQKKYPTIMRIPRISPNFQHFTPWNILITLDFFFLLSQTCFLWQELSFKSYLSKNNRIHGQKTTKNKWKYGFYSKNPLSLNFADPLSKIRVKLLTIVKFQSICVMLKKKAVQNIE